MLEEFRPEFASRASGLLHGSRFQFDGQLLIDVEENAFLEMAQDLKIEITDAAFVSRVFDAASIYVGGRYLTNDRAVLDGELGVRDGELVILSVQAATIHRDGGRIVVAPLTSEFEQ